MEKKFDVIYTKDDRINGGKIFSHKYEEPWRRQDIFCPKCGKKEVWMCDNGGDYYVGEQYLCVGCEATFYMPGGASTAGGEQDEQRLSKLRER